MMEKKMTEPALNNPLNYERAADYLGISVNTLYSMVCNKKITCHKPSRKQIFFRREDLDAYAYRNKILADFEVNEKAEDILNKEVRK
jgi:excisionase family DNA binding protein